jgi:MarR family transcriptional regulator, organic hydroperoxide resistance regulator
MTQSDVRQVMGLYPKIFFACHTRHVRDPKTRQELSAHQASILDHLDATEPLPLMSLAKHMGVTPSTMSLSIKRLVRQGYVHRTRDANDARRICLRLAPAGVRVRETNSVLEPARVRAMLARLSPAQRGRALDGLALLARAAQQYMEETAPKRWRWGSGQAERGGSGQARGPYEGATPRRKS